MSDRSIRQARGTRVPTLNAVQILDEVGIAPNDEDARKFVLEPYLNALQIVKNTDGRVDEIISLLNKMAENWNRVIDLITDYPEGWPIRNIHDRHKHLLPGAIKEINDFKREIVGWIHACAKHLKPPIKARPADIPLREAFENLGWLRWRDRENGITADRWTPRTLAAYLQYHAAEHEELRQEGWSGDLRTVIGKTQRAFLRAQGATTLTRL